MLDSKLMVDQLLVNYKEYLINEWKKLCLLSIFYNRVIITCHFVSFKLNLIWLFNRYTVLLHPLHSNQSLEFNFDLFLEFLYRLVQKWKQTFWLMLCIEIWRIKKSYKILVKKIKITKKKLCCSKISTFYLSFSTWLRGKI